MAGGGSRNQNQTTRVLDEPWAPSQPFLKDAMSAAQGIYNRGGFAPNPYPGDTVANLNPMQQRAMAQMQRTAMNSQVPGATTGTLLDAFNSGNGVWGAAGNAARAGLGQVGASFGNPNVAMGGGVGRQDFGRNMAVMGRPNMGSGAGRHEFQQNMAALGSHKGNLDAVKKSVLDTVMPAATAPFVGSGMLDSSVARDSVARSAASAIAPIEYGAAENERQRRMGMLENSLGRSFAGNQNERQLRAGMLENSLGRSFAGNQAGLNRGMQLGEQMMTQGLRGAALAPSVAGMEYMPGQQMLSLGGMQQQQQQAEMNAAIQRYMQRQQQPADNLNAYTASLLGFGGQGSTRTGMEQQPGVSRGAGALGGALSGAAAGSAFGLPGTIGGGLLGGLLGLF